MNPLSNGYYASEGKYFEDWHAGHKDEGHIYSFLKLNQNSTFLKVKRRNIKYDFIEFLKEQTKKELPNDTSTMYGKYFLKENNIIEFIFRIMNSCDMHFELQIITPEILRDKDGMEYRFIPVDEDKLKDLPDL